MRLSRMTLAAALLSSLLPVSLYAQGAGPVFHAVGDLPGGPTRSVIRGATRVGTRILAVGGGAALPQNICTFPGSGVPAGCLNFATPDTGLLWQFDAVSGTASLTSMPALAGTPTNAFNLAASAITPDGVYIASQARATTSTGLRAAVRVQTSLLPFPSANLRLDSTTNVSNAQTISDDGSVLYGNVGGAQRRFDLLNPAGNVVVPRLNLSDVSSGIALHGASADGLVATGFSAGPGPDQLVVGRGFRYTWNPLTNTGTIVQVPFLPTGTWNRGIGLTPDGRYMLMLGDSTHAPNGSVYIYDASTNEMEDLGSPSGAWRPSTVAGITDDRSVVAISYFSQAGNNPGMGYIHNQYGWFTMGSVLRSAGIDLRADGWDVENSFNITGISGDGTLLYGAMPHNGQFEGFVMEFPAGYLASFNPPLTPPSLTAIVGAWTEVGKAPGDEDTDLIVLRADGTYVVISSDVAPGQSGVNGVEVGAYHWDPATHAITFDARRDSDGDHGTGGINDRTDVTAVASGDTMTIDVPDDQTIALTRVPTDVTSLGGAWTPSEPGTDSAIIFLPDGNYYLGETHAPSLTDFGGRDGMERGTYTWDAVTGQLTATIALESNGQWGLSDPFGAQHAVLGPDGLTGFGGDTESNIPLLRIVDPDLVRPVISSATTIDQQVNHALSYAITATFSPLTYGASNLPPGLSIDTATGIISGTPTQFGTFVSGITASNTLATGAATLTFNILPPVVIRSGFYQPVKPGVNIVKAGSAVPLKFNVSIEGVEKTDVTGLSLLVQPVSCGTGLLNGTPGVAVSTGSTSLRWDGTEFIGNWQTPSTAGCYVVSMTTAADGGSISASFQLK